mmetsp:Transcript_17990/g.26702  ORF Transcript_17990/g.26702 Transcript_17990/m.26702 type:complete len:138 (-) Transcript_17990:127-540(-)|eukprot:CAMPEP_0194037238 /NCGR_PEP_ID=MMETSP0009_2-20130614/9569_1 /TAXON_ID=210454 /ORGANISM="Grammatophora oceanica, Strain CCMP 410" /LENGTH=137 /DNA_ID=CAMNT_0038679309 /DNA_START=257 /DNA_END=670 /DNA_ORIENTATION=+
MPDVVALVHSHHLLDHSPDNNLLKGSKYNLRGVACLGRPGVALCVGPQESIDNFRMFLESKMPQKKFETILLEGADPPVNSFEPATLGQLRNLLAGIGHENHFFALTGINPATATTVDTNKKGGGKTGKGGKGRKKR